MSREMYVTGQVATYAELLTRSRGGSSCNIAQASQFGDNAIQMLPLPLHRLERVECKCSFAASIRANKRRSRTSNQNKQDRHTQIVF